jgi:hypothetical protein
MGRLHKTTLILGEGPTEFFYFKSLNDVFKGLTIKPDYPKHTSIKELELKITDGISMGYDYIFCVIDMDTKDEEPERTQYIRLKKKYKNPIVKLGTHTNKLRYRINIHLNLLKYISRNADTSLIILGQEYE